MTCSRKVQVEGLLTGTVLLPTEEFCAHKTAAQRRISGMLTRVRYGINELSANNNYLADFSWPSPKHACIQRTHMWQMIASRFCCSLKIHAKLLRVQSNRCFLHLGIFRVYLTHPPTHFRQSDDYTAVVTPNFIYAWINVDATGGGALFISAASRLPTTTYRLLLLHSNQFACISISAVRSCLWRSFRTVYNIILK